MRQIKLQEGKLSSNYLAITTELIGPDGAFHYNLITGEKQVYS